MNRDSYLTVLLAVCCIGAAGMASTTLASSLTEDPDDVVDIDYSKLPIGKDDGNSVKGAVQSEENQASDGKSDQENVENPQGESEKSGDSSEPSVSSGSSDEEASSQSSSDDSGNQGGGGDDSGDQSGGADSGTDPGGAGSEGAGDGTGPLSLLEQLWLLLEQLLPWLVVLVLAALAYRYRRNLLALALAIAAVFGDRTESRDGESTRWPSEPPANDVHRAWLSMVNRLDVDQPQTRTPSECASAAVEADMDPTAVQTLTDVFEEVRYGEKPVTEERRERARDGLRRLGGGETR